MLKKTAISSLLCLATALVLPALAHAKVPKVAVDIAPVQSLVAQVMDGVGTPALLIRPESEPHHYKLRPSEAKALANADIVFWVGEELTPWLVKPLSSLAGSAEHVKLFGLPGTTEYSFREDAVFAGNDHDHADHDDDEDEHHHGDHDPHAWLDPVNAQIWVKKIAATLSAADPEHAAQYNQNAKKALAQLTELTIDIQREADNLKDIKFVVFHDAYQYFEKRFGIMAVGSISMSDASKPSTARIAEIQKAVAKYGVTCVFTEPEFNPDLVHTVFSGSTVKTTGTMDPIGSSIPVGEGHYAAVLQAMITSLQQCKG